MSSKRLLRKNGCTGKVVYHSATEARVVLARLKREGRPLLNVYRCGFHGPNRPRHFHIGHRERADRARLP